MIDARRLKASWNLVAAFGDQVPLRFYSVLFIRHPELRPLFPVSTGTQRDRFILALGDIVSRADRMEELTPLLQQLGRDHRKFAVRAEHFPPVGAALVDTLAYFVGERWSEALAADWTYAFDLAAKVMTEAMDAAQQVKQPPWWDGEVIAHELRAPGVAALRVRLNQPMEYLPGQSVAVETHHRPKHWRHYSPANMPRADQTLDLHVRLVKGGIVSHALVYTVRPGDVLRLGSPVGHRLTLHPDHGLPLLLIAGGTGLAPLKALVDQIAANGGDRKVHLFVGARTEHDFHDMDALKELARAHGAWLKITPAAHDRVGTVADAALREGAWPGHEVYVCGSAEMVHGTTQRLVEAGVDHYRIHVEDFTGNESSYRYTVEHSRRHQ